LGDSSVTIAQWWRARHLRNLVIREVTGSIPAENTYTQIQKIKMSRKFPEFARSVQKSLVGEGASQTLRK